MRLFRSKYITEGVQKENNIETSQVFETCEV